MMPFLRSSSSNFLASFAVAREFPVLSLLAVMAVCPTLDKSEAEAKGRFSEPVATTDAARNTLFTGPESDPSRSSTPRTL